MSNHFIQQDLRTGWSDAFNVIPAAISKKTAEMDCLSRIKSGYNHVSLRLLDTMDYTQATISLLEPSRERLLSLF